MNDSIHSLGRFLAAQEPVYAAVLSELEAGDKQTHWMWFIFPQLRGLGYSKNAHYYGLESRSEAEAYLSHPVLGERLRTCTRALLKHAPRLGADEILGSPDDLKLRSCLTLFSAVEPGESLWSAGLTAFFAGQPDARTLKILASPNPAG